MDGCIDGTRGASDSGCAVDIVWSLRGGGLPDYKCKIERELVVVGQAEEKGRRSASRARLRIL